MNNREENITEGSLPYPPELNDACLANIAAFMDLNESALVCRDFLQVSGETALRRLEAKLVNHQTDDDFMERLVVSVSTSLQNYLAPNNPNMEAAVVVPHQRLLLRRVDTIPMVTRQAPCIGPSATLPNGNIVIVCREPDNMIRILDMQSMEIVTSVELGFVPPVILDEEPLIDWVTDHLFYSNGYLVLHRKGFGGADTEWIHVWSLEQDESIMIQFLYSKECSTTDDANALQDVAVADDATMYLLWRKKQDKQEVSYKIESIQVQTGELLFDSTIQMPSNTDLAKLPRDTTSKLIVAGKYLLMLRHLEERGSFPGIGLGAYAFSRDDLSQSDFLPCFQDFEVHINHDESGRTGQYILYEEFTGGAFPVYKKISINDTTGSLAVGVGIAFGPRTDVVLATPTSVFTHDPDENLLALDEYDLQSGTKLRTLEMGVPREGPHLVASVLASQEQGKVFISVSGGFRGNHIILSFLL